MFRVSKSLLARLSLVVLSVMVLAMGGSTAASAQNYKYHSYLPVMLAPVVQTQPGVPPVYGYTIVNDYPHDTSAYTEGLLWDNGYLYESTGQYNHSGIRKVQLTTGQVLMSQAIDGQYFGEGIAIHNGTLYELTWLSHVGFKWNQSDFSAAGQWTYSTQGWGMTTDGTNLIYSDGTSTIRFLDPNTPNLNEVREITVTDQGNPVTNINELEWVKGQIYANIWLTDRVYVISPQTGQVTAKIDLTGLRAKQGSAVLNNQDAVLNGIAYDPSGNGHLYVTGKLWSHLYEIKLVAPAAPAKRANK